MKERLNKILMIPQNNNIIKGWVDEAIKRTALHCGVESVERWAKHWLDGTDRTAASAWAAEAAMWTAVHIEFEQQAWTAYAVESACSFVSNEMQDAAAWAGLAWADSAWDVDWPTHVWADEAWDAAAAGGDFGDETWPRAAVYEQYLADVSAAGEPKQ